jgi:hypothetical protein
MFCHYRFSLAVCLLAATSYSGEDTLNFTGSLGPVTINSRFSDPDYYIWCGSCIRGEDGKYYLFYSRWLAGSVGRDGGDEQLFRGFGGWLKYSEIAVAVSNAPTGPFKHIRTILRGTLDPQRWDCYNAHNPHVKRFGERVYLYYIATKPVGNAPGRTPYSDGQRIGVAIANSVSELVSGRFQRSAEPLMAPDGIKTFSRTVNPGVTVGRDGRFYMMFKTRTAQTGGHMAHWIAIADRPEGPFHLAGPALTDARYDAEDPYFWYDSKRDRYYAIVKDFSRELRYLSPEWGALALVTSENGIGDWRLAKHPLVTVREYTDALGQKHRLANLERPQLLFDENQQPMCLYAAASEDELSKGKPSFNLHFTLDLKPSSKKGTDQ